MLRKLFSKSNRKKREADDSAADEERYFPLQEPYGQDWADEEDDADRDGEGDGDREDIGSGHSYQKDHDHSEYDDPEYGDPEYGDTEYGDPDHDDRDYDHSDYESEDYSDGKSTKARRPSKWWQPRHYKARGKLWWFIRGAATVLLFFFLTIIWLAFTAPLSKSLEPIAPPQLTLLAADGTPIARNGAIVDRPVVASELPEHVIEPFLAVEDRRFYSHWGVDPRGVARAAWSNIRGEQMQGGSTITQQLAKFTFLTPERSLARKGREMLIAFWLEAWLSKDEILERYLSNAYFGDNVYGLRAASLHYFYRHPENLKPEQAAMLAGLLQAPSRYAPTRHYDRAKKRMDIVLGAMVAAQYLTQAEADALPKPQIDSRTRNDLPTGTYFADWALPEARRLSEGGYNGVTMTTTLDSRLQRIARRVTRQAALGDAQIALVAMRSNGEVAAMVGGKDYAASPFNRATQARRQPGSTFKLFVYLAALEAGMEPEDMIDNRAFESGSYRPKNADERYSETISMEDGFARSSNVAAVRLFNVLGDEAVIEMAREFGISSPLPRNDPSLALGTSSVTLLELTSAYAGVAANRFPIKPVAFAQEEEGWFARIWNWFGSLSGSVHEDMEQMLRKTVNKGTGRAAMLNVPNYGKTGTSQGNRDALFVGYAQDLVVGVWVGRDDNGRLQGVTGGGLPARVWRNFMVAALSDASGSPRYTAPKPSGGAQVLDPQNAPEEPEDGPDEGAQGDAPLRLDEDGGVILSTDIEGVPVDVRLDEEGLRVNAGEE